MRKEGLIYKCKLNLSKSLSSFKTIVEQKYIFIYQNKTYTYLKAPGSDILVSIYTNSAKFFTYKDFKKNWDNSNGSLEQLLKNLSSYNCFYVYFNNEKELQDFKNLTLPNFFYLEKEISNLEDKIKQNEYQIKVREETNNKIKRENQEMREKIEELKKQLEQERQLKQEKPSENK